ncbi:MULTISPECIES: hypothetical protein [unclassified Variovorax]|uniref:hypothetical protein n=1 Tax=unclassified Variovorax TaxID=663243 RepID=UPI00076BCBBE|nr:MULTISPECIES: hypothetical protein [unclassified Variovorax]KWT98135.1 hypothetical protein APY03_0806 [Variovorax sp. WDL1]PNG50388.1 hypothetical protein CHC06_06011 [Variovorax sp. B2]PNG51261.1 hypothetical protein CHC07_05917 [Variovorax sp. B4]VTV17506.1 hypothetical protein WDL1P1_00439 [Variovorax sp. WDL1]
MALSSRSNLLFEVAGVVREAYKLLDNKQGNNGRAIRRFIRRHGGCVNGQIVFVQSFCFEDGYSPEQLAAVERYAKTIDELNATFFPADVVIQKVGCARDDDFGSVANVYIVQLDIDTASVREMRHLVHLVLVLNDTLQEFAVSRNATALFDYPDYVYRGLGCDCASATWAVEGKDKQGSSGVLEWCIDEVDALERLALMQAHPHRFPELSVASPAMLGITA